MQSYAFTYFFVFSHAQPTSLTFFCTNCKGKDNVQFLIYAGAKGDFFGLPYDYWSLMHYWKGSHSKKPGEITIQTWRDPNMQEVTSSTMLKYLLFMS